MRSGMLVLSCLWMAGCTGSPPPAFMTPEEMKQAVLPPQTLTLDARLDIGPFVDAYVGKLKESRILDVQTRLTSQAEVLALQGAQGGNWTPDSAVYLVTIHGNLVWPGTGDTSIDLLTGETVTRATLGDVMYAVFSAQDGQLLTYWMPTRPTR